MQALLLRDQTTETPFLFLFDEQDKENSILRKKLDEYPHIFKPYSVNELFEAVRKIDDRHKYS